MSSGTSILQSIIQAINPKDKACVKRNYGLWRTENILIGTSGGLKLLTRMLFVGYSTGLPANLGAFIRSFEQASKNLNASIVGTGYYEIEDLLACIRAFSEDERQLGGFLRSYQRGTFDLRSIVKGWKIVDNRNLHASLFAIEPRNLIAALRAQREGTSQQRGIIRGWYYDDKDLNAVLQPYVEEHLGAEINTILPIDLSSYIRVWPYRNLLMDIYGWAIFDLKARIAPRGEGDLVITVGGHYPSNLRAIMRAFYVGNYDSILASITVQHIFDMSATVNCFNVDRITLGAFINSRPIHLLNASIIGWAHRDLDAAINAIIPVYYLHATITAHGGYKNLTTYILGLLGTQQSKDLSTTISGWQHIDLLASISSINYVSFMASITPIGGAKDLKADIKVREIIFNEFYKFSTANTSDLRAYIGFSLCTLRTPRSAYASLVAAISSVPTYDLNVRIDGIKVIFNGIRDLGVLINYTNKYSILSKFLSFKISTSVADCIRPSPAFFKNSLNITFKIINGQAGLKALITSQPHNLSLGASIYSRLLVIHGRSNERVLTEEMVEIDNYRKKWSAYIDIYLRTEKPIYYVGGKVFAKDYGEPIISFLFKRSSSLGIKYEYNLRHDLYFDSTDAAIRYGLVKTSGNVATSELVAKITSIVKNLKLNVTIQGIEKEPLYTEFPFTYLKSGSLSTMGTCINHILYKSKSNIFGGIQDMGCNISAVPN